MAVIGLFLLRNKEMLREGEPKKEPEDEPEDVLKKAEIESEEERKTEL